MTDHAAIAPALAWGPLLESHPLAHYVYDTGTLRLLAANDAALARYGYSREEFTALTRADLLLPSEVPLLREFIAGLPDSARVEPQHVWLERTRTGRVLHADIRGMPVLFEGRPARLAAVVDAGGRARLQADASSARDLLEMAGRVAQLGGWSVDLLTRRVRWSDVVCAIHEVPPGTECDLDAATGHYPGAAAETIGSALRRCALHGEPFDLELPFVGARGTERWVRAVGAAVRNGSGRIVAMEGAQQDITERKRDALALAESRSRLAALLGALPDLWFVFDARMRYAEVSDVDHPALSAPWSEKAGRAPEEVLEAGHARALRTAAARARETGQAQSYHYELRNQAGERRTYESRCMPLSGGRTMMLARDITDAVELERRFQAMADAAPIGIYMTDTHGHCTYTNPAWQQLYGLSAEASLGRAWIDALHDDDRRRVLGELAAAPGVPHEIEYRLQPAGQPLRSVVARSSPIRRADGSISGYVGMVVDVTQARELQAARQAQAVAEEAGRRQAAFMSRVSHELRTPLNAILGFGQLLQDNAVPNAARAQAFATHVVQAGRHMLSLVDDLLQLQRLEQGRLQVLRAPVDVAQLLAACADMLAPSATAQGVQLSVHSAPGLLVHSDERCLRQMLLNLVSNAIKYGRGSRRPASVALSAQAHGDAVLVSVADEGDGMTSEQLARLFRPFERLGQEAGSQPGTGLGLVITQHLAQLLGAEIKLRSQPGSGTTATLRVPR